MYRLAASRSPVATVGIAASLLAISLALAVGCKREERDPIAAMNAEVQKVGSSEKSTEITPRLEREIVSFCSDCHEMPQPSSFPKHAWPEEVEQGYSLYFDSGRTDLFPPSPKRLVVEYFQRQAPDELDFPPMEASKAPPKTGFQKQNLQVLHDGPRVVVSNVSRAPETSAHGKGLIVCDMENGHLIWTDPLNPNDVKVLGTFYNPASVTVTDLDSNGEMDYVVADLGSFLPADHDRGKIYWLHRDSESDPWDKQVLLSNVGRVVSIAAEDFDGDSKIDLIASEFGWRNTGSMKFLRNQSSEDAVKFKIETLDPRAGGIQVQKCDLNEDGHMDVVTVLSQEHEKVVAFLNKGDGTFSTETIWAAGYPSYGSSGIELVDMDGDDDLDVLYTNGDSFDDYLIKPYHSIQWLENQGEFPFVRHELAKMPGVHRALAGDVDGDGDLDVVAVAMLPEQVRNGAIASKLDSMILLEQEEDGNFRRHRLESGMLDYASFAMDDFDGDNDLDLAVGVFWRKESADRMTLWWNLLHN